MSIGIYSENLVNQALSLTPSTENLQFPATNLLDDRRTKVFRSTTNSDSIIVDFQETSEIDSIFAVDNQLDGFGISTLDVDFNATSDFSSPPVSISVPIDTKHGVALKEFTQVEYRFARIRLTSTLGYCELSKIFIGKKLVIPDERCINFGWTYDDQELSKVQENRYGQKFIDIISRQRRFNFRFSLLDKDQIEAIFDVYDRAGKTKPFFIAIGDTSMATEPNRFASMVYLNTVPQITNDFFNRYSLSFSVEEAT